MVYAEISSLKEELRIAKDVMKKALASFEYSLEKITKKPKTTEQNKESRSSSPPSVDQSGGDKQSKEKDDVHGMLENTVKKTKDPNQKGLFKKIARAAHPDKLSKASDFEVKYKIELFEAARAAMEDGDFHTVCEVAKKLKIDLPDPNPANLSLMKDTKNRLMSEIKSIKTTLVWQWYIEEDLDRKKAIMSYYINNFFNA